ncbi:hypothetical protein SRHO_G00245670 [Serrasalmus rhombeus]
MVRRILAYSGHRPQGQCPQRRPLSPAGSLGALSQEDFEPIIRIARNSPSHRTSVPHRFRKQKPIRAKMLKSSGPRYGELIYSKECDGSKQANRIKLSSDASSYKSSCGVTAKEVTDAKEVEQGHGGLDHVKCLFGHNKREIESFTRNRV